MRLHIALLRYALLSMTLSAWFAHAEPVPLEVLVLGSGGPGATGRAGSSYAVLLDGKPRILLDAGPGAFVRAGEAKLSMAAMDVILLTHLHADHAGGLPGLVKARAVSSRGDIVFHVFGPGGSPGGRDAARFPSTSAFIDLLFGPRGAFAYLRDFSAPLSFKVTNIDARSAPAGKPKRIYTEDGLVISAAVGHHRDAPAVIYRIDYRGRSVTFTGDIDPAGHAALKAIAQGTNLLIFNSVVLDPPGSPPHLYTLHTAPGDIGIIANDVKAGALLLSHLSPGTDGAREEVLASIKQRYNGRLQFAEDGLRVAP